MIHWALNTIVIYQSVIHIFYIIKIYLQSVTHEQTISNIDNRQRKIVTHILF